MNYVSSIKLTNLLKYKTMKEEQKITKEEAFRVLQEEEANKLKECSEKISKILDEHGYRLDIIQTIQLNKK